MTDPAHALTPDALRMLRTIAHTGSLAGAARALGLVPSALTYRVRQLEDALDVLLFDRSARRARPTAAGAELLRQAERLERDLHALVHRVKRVATGWEPRLTIAVDGLIARPVLMELVQAFYAQQPPTQLRLRDEILSGTVDALSSGLADLALGTNAEHSAATHLHARSLGQVRFVYAVAPQHALARLPEPLADAELLKHRGVVVADSTRGGPTPSFGVLEGQDALIVSSVADKLDAHLRGLGAGFLPEPMARPHLASGRLVARQVERSTRVARLSYAWSASTVPGKALGWWLAQLEHPVTRRALLADHRQR
ncbi:MAG: LysR family transcriptional regulator [Pseudomonadota bacterium]|nr:LysR family transcriptional regulator [Pseudomonadota bacterium]